MAAAEYDAIAEVYDETRRPLDGQTLEGLREALSRRGCRSVLEIGVGTGRVALPLLEAGFQVTGVDVSLKMMRRARSKGEFGLVLGDGLGTPFRGRSFDAVILAHVIHLIEDPCGLVGEAERVSKEGVFALIRKRGGNRAWFPFYGAADGGSDGGREASVEEMRAGFRRIAAKYGWTWDSGRPRNWGREAELLERCPPESVEEISDVVVNETLEDRVARVRTGAFSFTSTMPPAMREEVILEMRKRSPSSRPRHEVYQLAFWSSSRV